MRYSNNSGFSRCSPDKLVLIDVDMVSGSGNPGSDRRGPSSYGRSRRGHSGLSKRDPGRLGSERDGSGNPVMVDMVLVS